MPNETGIETPTAETPDEVKFNLQDVERSYFSPEELQSASESVETIMENVDEKLVQFNFANPEEITDGFGLAIIPNTKRVEGVGTVTQSVTIAMMPDPSTILANEKGESFVRDLIISSMFAKVANSARVRPDGTSGTLPVSVADFMENRRGKGEGLKVYTEIASHFVKGLRAKGLKLINAPILRNCLQSAQFAEEQFEKIEQVQWVFILDLMIAKAQQLKLDPALFIDWKDKRDAFAIDTVDEVDFSDLAGLVDPEPATE